jgi:hypothetical protein
MPRSVITFVREATAAMRSFSIGFGEICDAVLDRVVEPLELGVCLGRALARGGDMRWELKAVGGRFMVTPR